MKFSLNKLEMLSVSAEPAKIPSYFPSFAVYHSRYDDLGEEDFDNFFWDWEKKESFKGFTPYWNVRPQQRPKFMRRKTTGLLKSLKSICAKSFP